MKSTANLLPSADSKRKYVKKVLDNGMVKLAPEKVWIGKLTVLI